jgi:lysophospholipase L1-like esterase
MRLLTAASAALATVGLLACGGSDGLSLPVLPQASSAAVVRAGQQPIANAKRYTRPVLHRARNGSAIATFSAPVQRLAPASIRLSGIGALGRGKTGGRDWVGPGVDLPWTTIAQGSYSATVVLDGTDVGLVVWNRGGRWQATVDGKAVQPTPQDVGPKSAFDRLTLHFSTRARRTITFKLAGGAWIAGLRAGARDTVSIPPAPKRAPSMYWLGDSYSAGGGASYPGFDGMVQRAASKLELGDLVVDALGGTGYAKANTIAKFPTFGARVRENLTNHKVNADFVVIVGSINDEGRGAQRVKRAARALFARVRRALPRAKIVVVPTSSTLPAKGRSRISLDAIKAAARATKGVTVFDLPAAAAKAGAEDVLSADAHPTEQGHRLFGDLIARELARKFPSLRK